MIKQIFWRGLVFFRLTLPLVTDQLLVGAFSVITNLRMELFEALVTSHVSRDVTCHLSRVAAVVRRGKTVQTRMQMNRWSSTSLARTDSA